jgi:hypothetical protein
VEDLEAVGPALYCLSCRTCPHGRVWIETWAPACPACVLAVHTTKTPDGPRIKDLEAYLTDVARCRVDVMAHSFDEWERIGDRATYGDGLGVEVDWPFHFTSLTQEATRSR